jgi:hypothetical protein
VLVAPPHVRPGPTIFDDLMVVLTQRGLLHGARRQLTPPVSPLTVLPGASMPAPAAPPSATPTETVPGNP